VRVMSATSGKRAIGSPPLVYRMSLLRHIGTNCACTHAYILVFTTLQDNMMHLSKLLLTSYQFSSLRISIECVVVLRVVR